ncbi:hypothetical protein Trydic_g20067 [Trypoxylus dichotomus]
MRKMKGIPLSSYRNHSQPTGRIYRPGRRAARYTTHNRRPSHSLHLVEDFVAPLLDRVEKTTMGLDPDFDSGSSTSGLRPLR